MPIPSLRRPAATLALLAAVASLLVPAAPAAAAPEPGQYVPVPPVTAVDNLSLAAGATTTATVTNLGGVPPAPAVSAVAVNVIANQPAGTGHLTLFRAGTARPVDSTLNYQVGRTTAAFEVVAVPADGRITVFTPTATTVVVRLRGWYAPTPTPQGADWAQDRNGPVHPGTNAAEPVLTGATVRGLGQAWSAATGETRGGPVVVDDVVYAGSLDGRVHALDAATGAVRWTTAIGGNPMFTQGPSPAPPTVANGIVYVSGPHNGRLYALDAATGAVVWNVTAGSSAFGVALAGGVLHTGWGVGGGTTLLRALDPATGATLWTVGGGVVAPVVANGVHYSATVTGALLARDPATGAVLWSDTSAIGRSTSFPLSLVVANGAVYTSRLSGVTAHHP